MNTFEDYRTCTVTRESLFGNIPLATPHPLSVRQLERFKGTNLTCNAEMTSAEVREFCQVEDSAQSLLKAAMKQFYLSARAFHRILKLARTIADIEGADIIKAHHLAETIQYRPRSQI